MVEAGGVGSSAATCHEGNLQKREERGDEEENEIEVHFVMPVKA